MLCGQQSKYRVPSSDSVLLCVHGWVISLFWTWFLLCLTHGSSTVPRLLLTSHRPAPQGSCPPGGRHSGGACRHCRLSACWKRSCHPPCQPGSGCPGCWLVRPLLAGGVGGARWLLPVSGFHAATGGRIHQPEAGNRGDLTELTIGVSVHRPSSAPGRWSSPHPMD